MQANKIMKKQVPSLHRESLLQGEKQVPGEAENASSEQPLHFHLHVCNIGPIL